MTRPILNRSFTIKHTVSLPLRRHSYTQSQLATSVKRHSDLIPYLARGSLGTRARVVDARSTFLITDIIKYFLYSRDLNFLIIYKIIILLFLFTSLYHRVHCIIESVDSISKDERGFPLTQYISNGRISRGGYTFTHFNHDHRVLRLISYSMSV